jgi:histidine triad (HIT) family protein
MPSDCIFCAIADGEIPADIVHNDELVVAFRDVNPKAPTHILLISREHIASAAELTEDHASLLARLFVVAGTLARSEGIAESGYRLVTNVGGDAGQSVHHLHLHLLGGRSMSWPPRCPGGRLGCCCAGWWFSRSTVAPISMRDRHRVRRRHRSDLRRPDRLQRPPERPSSMRLGLPT